MRDLMTPQAVAAELGVRPVTVRAWIASGKIEAFKVGGRWKILRAELARFLARGGAPAGASRP